MYSIYDSPVGYRSYIAGERMLRGTPASVGSCSSPGGPLEPGGGDAAAALMPGTGGGEESLAVAWTQQGDEEKLWAAAMAAVEAACSGEAAPEAEAAAPALVAPAAVLLQLPAPPPPLKGRVCIPCRCARGLAASVCHVCCVYCVARALSAWASPTHQHKQDGARPLQPASAMRSVRALGGKWVRGTKQSTVRVCLVGCD